LQFAERNKIGDYHPAVTELDATLLRARYRLELQEAFRMLSLEGSQPSVVSCAK
jgi:hypothetical protein